MRDSILIVDNVKVYGVLLSKMLTDDYGIVTAESGREAIEVLEKRHNEIAVMLLNLVIPETESLKFLEELKRRPWSDCLGIIIISSEDTYKLENRCLDLGVSDFIHRPFNEKLVKKRVDNIAALYRCRAGLEQSKENVIDILETVVEYRNLESGKHIKRVKKYTKILASRIMREYPEYGLTYEKVEIIASASTLHDIGKIAIPDSILLKPGKLTKEERECLRTHVAKGCEILNNIENTWDQEYGKTSYEICRYHHERYDGGGYPEGLCGDEIPISAQIVSIADVYDALVSERVYKKAYSKEKSFNMIMNGECGAFSPKLLNCFCSVRKEFEALTDITE